MIIATNRDHHDVTVDLEKSPFPGQKLLDNLNNFAKVLNLDTKYSLSDQFAKDLESVYRDFSSKLPSQFKSFAGQKLNSISSFLVTSSKEVLLLCYSTDSMTELRLYDEFELSPIETKKITEDCLRCLVVDETQKLAIVSGGLFENRIFVYNMKSLEEIKVLSTNKPVKSLAACFVKKSFVSLGKEFDTIEWDLEELGKFTVVTSESFDHLAVAVNTGRTVLATSYGKIVVFGIGAKIEVKEMVKIKKMVVSDYGDYIAVDTFRSVVVFKVDGQSVENVFSKEFEGTVKDLTFTSDDVLVVCLKNGNVMLLDFVLYRNPVKLQIDKIQKIVHYSSEVFLVLADAKLYTVKVPKLLQSYKIENCSFTALSPNNKCAYIMGKSSLRELDLSTGVHRDLLQPNIDMQKLQYIDDSKLLIVTAGKFIVFNPETTEILLEKKKEDDEYVYFIKINYEKQLIYMGGNKKIVRVYDLQTLEKITEFGKHVSTITFFVEFSDWTHLVTREINFVRIFNLETLVEVKVIEDKIIGISITPDDKRLFLHKQHVIRIYDLGLGMVMHEITHRAPLIYGLHFFKNYQFFVTLTSDAFLRFWDYSTYTLIFEIPTAGAPDYLKLTPDEQYFLIRTEIKYKTILIIKNPLSENSINFYGPSQNYYAFLNYFIDIKNHKQVQFQEEFEKTLVMPGGFTITHLFAYQGMAANIKSALAYNPVFSSVSVNYTPLDICLLMNHKNSVLVFLKFFSKCFAENPFIANSIKQENLIRLNMLGFESLVGFYDALLYVNPHAMLPKMVKYSEYLPKVRKSKEFLPDLTIFNLSPTSPNEGVNVEFVTSLIQLNISSGSRESINFLSSLIRCPYPDIFRSKFIQMLINYKWQYVFLISGIECLFFSVYMAFLSAISLGHGSIAVLIIFFIFGFTLMFYEFLQVFGGIKVYLHDMWNFVDIIRAIFMMVYLESIVRGNSYSETFLLLLNLASWVRGISYFRIFSKTRYMINLITEVCKDVLPFLVILTYSTIAFSFILMLMDSQTYFYTYFELSYLITLGVINSVDYSTVQWICFIFTTVMNPIILMNLLISIMGDTHDRVQEGREIAEYKELTNLIFEIEVASLFRRSSSSYQRFHVCQEVMTKGIAATWVGKVREIKTMISSLKLTQQKSNDQSAQMITENLKLKEQLSRIEKMLTGLKEKLIVEDNEANDFDVVCEKGHKLGKSYNYESMAKCSKCKNLNEVGYSCGICSYFLCRSCYKVIMKEKVSVSEFSCFRDHKVQWLADAAQYKNKLKVFMCVGCKKKLYKNSYNCEKCSWDICRKCVEIIFIKSTQAWSLHCDNQHALGWVKKSHPNYKCNICSNVFSNVGSYKCGFCDYDICVRCFSLQLPE